VGLRADTLASKLASTGGVSLFDPKGNLVGSTGGVPAVSPKVTTKDALVRTNVDDHQVLVGSLKGRGQTILRLAVFSQAGSILYEVRATAMALALLGTFATLGVLLLGWWLARTITRRLERVADAARRITRGDLSPRAEVVGADEIGLLATTFNPMTAELETRSQKLEERERHFRSIVQNSSDVVMIVDRFGKFTYQSPSLAAIFGHDADAHLGAHLSTIVHPDDLSRLSSTIGEISTVAGSHRAATARIRHADGRWRRAEIVLTNLLEEPAVGGIVLNTRDVTERTQLEDQLRHQAYHDALTGLANRVLFSSRVREVLSSDQRDIAVLFVDLDDFKTVNDSLGHAAGDQLLQAVARRLESCLRPQDVVARLGGDEFALLRQAGDGPLDAYGVSQRILDALQVPVSIDGREIVVCASIGVADDASTAATVDELLQHADLALAEAKRKGRNRFEPYQQVMANQVHERLELGVQLRRGLERNELSVHYQPIFDLGTRRLAGFEALSRWSTHDGQAVSPDLFIPLAEETGLIHVLGRRALEEACRQLRRWQLATGDEGLSVSVNLSVRQLQEPDLVGHVQAALELSDLNPACLTLEITESVLMHDADIASHQLALLRAVGVKLAIDDCGTGYSSLSYIERFPVDVLKVDKSFIDGVVEGTRRSALLRTIAGLGPALGLTTVAEGVETDAQLTMLTELGYDRAQGYHLGRPVPAHEVDVLLAIDDAVGQSAAAAESKVTISARRY
jgi:diguanylate cyclase (GGDEF)-like protein/PAS domain S-box-containing protein